MEIHDQLFTPHKGFVNPEGKIIDIGDVSHLFWWTSRFPDLEFLSGGWVRWRIHPEDSLLEIEFNEHQDEQALLDTISSHTSFKPKQIEVHRTSK